MNQGKALLALIGGIAIGIVVGMLYAPAKGTMTRKKLIRKGNGYVDEINDTFVEFSDTLSEEYDTVKNNALDLVEKAKEKAAAAAKSKFVK